MQKINLIAQGVLELSHREKSGRQRRQRRQRRQPSGLNYSPRRNVFRRGQKKKNFDIFFSFFQDGAIRIKIIICHVLHQIFIFWTSNVACIAQFAYYTCFTIFMY